MHRQIVCFAEGKPGQWEAFCLDFDIAVQGKSFEQVYGDLNKAVAMYLESAIAMPEPERRRFLKRHAPLSVRLRFAWYALRAALTGRLGDGGKSRHEFTMPCPA